MKLSQTRGKGMPRSVRRFWEEVDKAQPDPECDDCWPDKVCEGCRNRHAQSLLNAERFA